MEIGSTAPATAWEAGRFNMRMQTRKLLFGRMHEDATIELEVFRPGSRVFCIASAGCTAIRLASLHEVVAVDINPVQLAYFQRRLAGGPFQSGSAERFLAFARSLAPLVGWNKNTVRKFVELDDPNEQIDFWRRYLDTRRFRTGLNCLLSRLSLRAMYAASFIACLPPKFGTVIRARMERCFSLHSNRQNPYARMLLLGEMPPEPTPIAVERIQLICADAAAFLEHQPAGSFDGFSLSNILDGANPAYQKKLIDAVQHAAATEATVVRRSFRDPLVSEPTNRAAADRSMLWGIVDVRTAASLNNAEQN